MRSDFVLNGLSLHVPSRSIQVPLNPLPRTVPETCEIIRKVLLNFLQPITEPERFGTHFITFWEVTECVREPFTSCKWRTVVWWYLGPPVLSLRIPRSSPDPCTSARWDLTGKNNDSSNKTKEIQSCFLDFNNLMKWVYNLFVSLNLFTF